MKNLFKKLVPVSAIALPLIAFGQVAQRVLIQDIGGLNRVIERIVNWVTGLFFVVAILFLFWAAYLYLTAAGDEKGLEKAKNQLIYSIIAITIALLAGSVRFIVENLLS